MQFTLMHRDIAVAELDIDEATGSIQRILSLEMPEHLPVGVAVVHGHVDRAALNDWWNDRSIPLGRSGVRDALERLRISDTKVLLTRSLGLSLSDAYWVRPQNGTLTWKTANFFENDFSEDLGDLLLGKHGGKERLDVFTPDSSSDGYLRKRWKILNGKRCLLKAGSNPFQQQPFNEVIAYRMAERLEIAHVPYSVFWDKDEPFSVCEDFLTPEIELIPAWRVIQTGRKDNNTSVFRHYLNCCDALGIPGVRAALDRMLVLDFLIANEDRHFNNFGVLRNAETLEWIGPAPLYDSGSSLGHDKVPGQILSGRNVTCKPFKSRHEEQILLVGDWSWFDARRLDGVESEIRSVFEEAREYMEPQRLDAILASLKKRIETAAALSQTEYTPKTDERTMDVEENVEEQYGPKLGM